MAARGVDYAPEKPKRRRYSLEERERGMIALVLAGDSAENASATTGIPATTLQTWRTRDYPERYETLRTELAPQVANRIASEAEAIALRLAHREAKVLEAFSDAAIGSMDAKDLSGALRNLATSKALQVDKISSPLRGRPTVVHAQEDPIQAGERLLKKYGITINSTATEVHDSALASESVGVNARELGASKPAD